MRDGCVVVVVAVHKRRFFMTTPRRRVALLGGVKIQLLCTTTRGGAQTIPYQQTYLHDCLIHVALLLRSCSQQHSNLHYLSRRLLEEHGCHHQVCLKSRKPELEIIKYN